MTRPTVQRPVVAGIVCNIAVRARQIANAKLNGRMIIDEPIVLNTNDGRPPKKILDRFNLFVIFRQGATKEQLEEWKAFAEERNIPCLISASASDLAANLPNLIDIQESPNQPTNIEIPQEILDSSSSLSMLDRVNKELGNKVLELRQAEQLLIDEGLRHLEERDNAFQQLKDLRQSAAIDLQTTNKTIAELNISLANERINHEDLKQKFQTELSKRTREQVEDALVVQKKQHDTRYNQLNTKAANMLLASEELSKKYEALLSDFKLVNEVVKSLKTGGPTTENSILCLQFMALAMGALMTPTSNGLFQSMLSLAPSLIANDEMNQVIEATLESVRVTAQEHPPARTIGFLARERKSEDKNSPKTPEKSSGRR